MINLKLIILNIFLIIMFFTSVNFLYSKNIFNSVPITSVEKFVFKSKMRYTLTGVLPNLESKLKLKESLIVGTTLGTVFLGQHYLQSKTIYKNKTKFRFIEDGAYAMYADKGGHLFSSYFASYLFSESFIIAGLNLEDSKMLGSIFGLSYQTYIEIMDGYGENWGFSPSDQYFNIIGATLFLGSSFCEELEFIIPKYSYIPANLYGNNKRIPSNLFVDDYSSQTNWLSINVYEFIPNELKPFWFKWLNISFGYAVRNLEIMNDTNKLYVENNKISWDKINYGNPVFIIAFDYNLVEIFPNTNIPFLNWLIQTLNYYKFPAPAIEFGKKIRFSLLYPF